MDLQRSPALILMDSLTDALMPPSDELIWHQAGFFDQVDSLEKTSCAAAQDTHPLSSALFPRSSHPASNRPLQNCSNRPFSPPVHRVPSAPHRVASNSRKVWKSNKHYRRLVLGDGVGLEDLVKMSLNALVGRFSYKSMSPQPLEDWIKSHWSPILGYCPEILYLKKGWFGFLCRSPKDASRLLSTFRVIGGSSLMLKR